MSVRLRGERGATAVIVAGSLILIMGIAAVALDGGQAFSERRQAQTGVDFAAMAALQAATSCNSGLPGCSLGDAANRGAAEARDVVAENLPGRALNWGACSDPDHLAVFATSTPCVSFTENFDRARVVLPTDEVDTAFGGVIGTDTIDVSALAEAGQGSQASSTVVPFAFSGGTHTCLFSNQAPQSVAPCDGPVNGNFGFLDIRLYGNTDPLTPTACTGSAQTRLESNIVVGTDHLLGTWSIGGLVTNDVSACPNRSETPNEIEGQPGYGLQVAATRGLVTGSASSRLRCDSGSCRNVSGLRLDDRPLWSYLVSGLSGACSGVNSRDSMIACLDSWTPSDGVIFTSALGDNRRFVAVPNLDSPLGNGAGMYRILEFLPVFLETVYSDCIASRCDIVHSPGEPSHPSNCPIPLTAATASCGPANGNWNGKRVEGLTALVLERGMLPGSILEFFPGTPGERIYSLTQ